MYESRTWSVICVSHELYIWAHLIRQNIEQQPQSHHSHRLPVCATHSIYEHRKVSRIRYMSIPHPTHCATTSISPRAQTMHRRQKLYVWTLNESQTLHRSTPHPTRIAQQPQSHHMHKLCTGVTNCILTLYESRTLHISIPDPTHIAQQPLSHHIHKLCTGVTNSIYERCMSHELYIQAYLIQHILRNSLNLSGVQTQFFALYPICRHRWRLACI